MIKISFPLAKFSLRTNNPEEEFSKLAELISTDFIKKTFSKEQPSTIRFNRKPQNKKTFEIIFEGVYLDPQMLKKGKSKLTFNRFFN